MVPARHVTTGNTDRERLRRIRDARGDDADPQTPIDATAAIDAPARALDDESVRPEACLLVLVAAASLLLPQQLGCSLCAWKVRLLNLEPVWSWVSTNEHAARDEVTPGARRLLRVILVDEVACAHPWFLSLVRSGPQVTAARAAFALDTAPCSWQAWFARDEEGHQTP